MILLLAPFVILGGIVAVALEIARGMSAVAARYDMERKAQEAGFAERLKDRLLDAGWSPPPATATPPRRTP